MRAALHTLPFILWVAGTSSCSAAPVVNSSPGAVAASVSAPPGDALDLASAMERPDGQSLKVVAWLLALGHDCAPCPENAECERCESPHPTFGQREPASPGATHSFFAYAAGELRASDVGHQFVLEGEWVGEEEDLRFFSTRSMQRVAR